MYYYLVLNNDFNRRYYPSLIGKRFVNPPLYPYPRASRPVQVRKLPLQSARRRPMGMNAPIEAHPPQGMDK